MLYTHRYISPAGELMLGVNSATGALCLCDWIDNRHYDNNMCKLADAVGPIVPEDTESASVAEVVRQLDQYFAVERTAFDLRLGAVGTPFQHRVWDALATIPYGATMTYGEVARAVGCPRGFQAVAAAVGANPISIIVPCHRVIGSDGSLTGFAGGLAAKSILLTFEASVLNNTKREGLSEALTDGIGGKAAFKSARYGGTEYASAPFVGVCGVFADASGGGSDDCV